MTIIDIPNPYLTTSKKAKIMLSQEIDINNQRIRIVCLLPEEQTYIQEVQALPVFTDIVSKLTHALKRFIQPNSAYPSHEHQTKKIYLVLDNNTHFKASVVPTAPDSTNYAEIQIQVSYYFYEREKQNVEMILVHELYHPIAQLEHEEAHMRKELFTLHNKYTEILTTEEVLIEEIVKSLESTTKQ